MTRNVLRTAVVVGAAMVLLAGCASAAPAGDAADGVTIGPDEPPTVIAASGEVLGQGTVLQVEGKPTNLCLGAVMESYPPQCSGPEVIGWDWASVDGSETANGVTWGTYAVQGTWDGERFTLTQPPIMLALYDPMPFEQPLLDPANAGATDEAQLVQIQSEMDSTSSVQVLSSSPMNGYLFVNVVYDDGQIQDYFDELYGPDVVVVESALRPISS